MNRNFPRRLLALSVCLLLLLPLFACTNSGPSRSDTLAWTRWNGFDNFLELAGQTYPEIK